MNIDDSEVTNFDNIFNKVKMYSGSVLTVSIHRRAYKQLSAEQLDAWAEYVTKKQLFCHISECYDQLNIYIK